MKMITATLKNIDNPNSWAEVTLPADDERLHEALSMIDIPISVEPNCILCLPSGMTTPFDSLNGKPVNADELNYLAMRLDSFDGYEMLQFQAAAACDGIADMTGLINLTFNIHNYTVVSDFSDHAAIGKRFYMDEHLAVPADQYNTIDATAIGQNLLQDKNGAVTPFGVVYKHGKEPEILYNGGTFPAYNYAADNVMTVGVISKYEPEHTEKIAWLYLPVPDISIKKALLRLDVENIEEACILHYGPDYIDGGIWQRFDPETESLQTLNEMCRALQDMDQPGLDKLNAACDYTRASTAAEITVLAGILNDFAFYPNVHNAEQYGMYCIQNICKYDENLAEFYDYKGFGEDRISKESGKFMDCGYVVYSGFPEELDELLRSEPDQSTTTGFCCPQ